MTTLAPPLLVAGVFSRRHTVIATAASANDSDATIIQDSLDNRKRFAPIFERHFAQIYRYLSQRTEPSAAEDLASEVFAIALNKRNKFVAQHDSALPWLYGIASNLLADQSRKRARQATAYHKAGSQEPVDTNPISGAQQRIDANAQVGSLKPALEALSERDQDILHLYAHAELSYTEIASALKMPVGTVRSRLHRIRRTLRKAVPSGQEG